MAQDKQELNFDRNPCNRLRYIDGADGRTNCDFMSSDDIVKQFTIRPQ